ncbi:MAG: glutaredoxin 3 [Gammaproteobacteria bacterium]|nr:glutaredoxin 3 [Gammaproteobacteria bacterium]
MSTATGVKMYGTRFCPYCMRARSLLSQKGVAFDDIAVDGDPVLRAQMMAESGRYTVPQIWVGETHVGGFDELWLLEQRGELDTLLQPALTQAC